MTVQATVDSTLNGQSADLILIEEGDTRSYEEKTLSGGTETFIFTELDGGEDKEYTAKIIPSTTDVTATAEVNYGATVDIDPIPHRDVDADSTIREDIEFSNGVSVSPDKPDLPLNVDGFEDNDVSEYTTDGNAITTSTNIVQDGTYSGLISGTGSGLAVSLPGDGLDNYPKAGDTIEAYLYPQDGDSNASIVFGTQGYSIDNTYRVLINANNDYFRFSVYESGNNKVLEEEDVSISGGQWYKIRVEWGRDGQFTVQLLDSGGSLLSELRATDETYKSGGFGWRAYDPTGGDVYYDNGDITTRKSRSTGLGLANNALVSGLLTSALNDGEVLADDGYVYSTVQAAQDAASSWIFIGQGTFNEAVTIDTPGLTVQGSGYNTLVDGGTSGDAIGVSVSNVTIKNISAQTPAGNGADHNAISFNAGATDGVVHNVTVRESDDYGIYIGDSDTVVSDCNISNADTNGIIIEDTRCIVGNNTISSSGENGIIPNLNGDDTIIYNNIISASSSNGIYIRSSDDCIAIGNRIINSTDNSVSIAVDNPANNIIANNRSPDNINDNGTGTLFDGNNTNASN